LALQYILQRVTMAKDNKAFELFQREFKRYQEHFGLMGYEVRFEHIKLDDAAASININQEEMVAYAAFNNKLRKPERSVAEIKWNAKHEALHLLTGRMRKYAYARHIMSDDIYEANEELVRRLSNLIPDLPDE